MYYENIYFVSSVPADALFMALAGRTLRSSKQVSTSEMNKN
jgi:hypothetical protein